MSRKQCLTLELQVAFISTEMQNLSCYTKHAFTLQQSLADFHWRVYQGGQQMTQSRNEERPDVWFPNTQLVLSHTMLTPSGGLQDFDSAHLCLLPPLHWESISFHPSLSDKKEVYMI